VDFPTPPLPEAIAIIFLILGISFPLIKLGFSFGAALTTFIFTLTTIS